MRAQIPVRGSSGPDAGSYVGNKPPGTAQAGEAGTIGNIIDEVTVTKGKTNAKGVLKNLQKVSITLPKPAKGQTTSTAGSLAKFSITISNTGLSAAGFDSDGITNTLKSTETGKKSVPRTIQVALVYGGQTYQIAASVNYSLSSKGDKGTIAGRSGM